MSLIQILEFYEFVRPVDFDSHFLAILEPSSTYSFPNLAIYEPSSNYRRVQSKFKF